MASFRKRGGKWYAEVTRKGNRKGKSFFTKAEALQWAAAEERDLSGAVPNKLVSALLERYSDEVSITKPGRRWEEIRLAMMGRDALAKVNLRELDATHISAWRDRRLAVVSAASVLREWNLLSSVFTQTVNEWKMIPANPMKGVRRPKPPNPRTRRVTDDEIARLCLALGYQGGEPGTTTARVAMAMLWAVETAMRAGEIIGLTSKDVDVNRRVAHLAKTKNGNSRDVPLSREAIRIWGLVPDGFGLTSANLDALFRKAKARALIDGLHFHDLRAEALTRMSRKVDVMTLAKISGHKDLRILQSVYYRESAEDIALRLD